VFKSIGDFFSQIKAKTIAYLGSGVGGDVALFLIILLVGLGSFGLGRLSTPHEGAGGINMRQAPVLPTPIPLPPGGTVVASRTGSVYYYPWCGGAKNINQANLIWYSSEEKAKAAGLRPAANCKGL